jgi:hypothetical protein
MVNCVTPALFTSHSFVPAEDLFLLLLILQLNDQWPKSHCPEHALHGQFFCIPPAPSCFPNLAPGYEKKGRGKLLKNSTLKQKHNTYQKLFMVLSIDKPSTQPAFQIANGTNNSFIQLTLHFLKYFMLYSSASASY